LKEVDLALQSYHSIPPSVTNPLSFTTIRAAIPPTNMKIQANPAGLIEQLWLLAAQPDDYFQDDAQKKEFQRLSRDAFTAMEEPFETMQRLVYGVSIGTHIHDSFLIKTESLYHSLQHESAKNEMSSAHSSPMTKSISMTCHKLRTFKVAFLNLSWTTFAVREWHERLNKAAMKLHS
jgi:hypothetical protein